MKEAGARGPASPPKPPASPAAKAVAPPAIPPTVAKPIPPVGQKVQPRTNVGLTPAAPAVKIGQARVEAKSGTPLAPKVAPAQAPPPLPPAPEPEPQEDEWEDEATRVQDVVAADVAKSREATPAAALPPVVPIVAASIQPAMVAISLPPPMPTAPPPMATAPPAMPTMNPASMQAAPPNWIPPRTYNTAPPKSIDDVKTFVQLMIDDALDPIQRALEYNDRRIDQLEKKLLEMQKNAAAAGPGVAPRAGTNAASAAAPLDPFGAVVVRPAQPTSAGMRAATTSAALREAARAPSLSLNMDVPFDGNRRKRRVVVVFTVFLVIVFGLLFGMLGMSYMH